MTDQQTNNEQTPQTPSSVPPKPEGQKPAQQDKNPAPQKSKGPSSKSLFALFLAIVLFCIGVFYILMLWALFSGDVNNPIFEAMGIRDQDLQSTLFLITHSVFGVLVVIFLINFLIGAFRLVLAERNDVRKKGYIRKTIVSFVIMLFMIGVWSFLYATIKAARTDDIGNTDLIQTEPSVTRNLNAPIQIKFNIGEQFFRKIDSKRVKQINWDFDEDGKYDASGAEVFYEFKNKGKNNGRFLVTATIIYSALNGTGEDVLETTREVIIVNESIAAEILSSTERGAAPLKVSFNAAGSYDPDGRVVYYEWDFNDDGIYDVKGENESKVDQIFQKVGTYKVALRVRGSNNDTDVAETTITVTSPEQNLKARIGSSQSKDGFAPYEVVLSGDTSFSRQGRIIKYTWFIDGEDEVIPSRTMKWRFSQPGQYLIRLVVENDLGEKDEEEIVINVKPPIKNANIVITPDKTTVQDGVLKGVTPFEVTFDSSRSEIENPIEWQWDFNGDGVIDAYDKTANYTYREKGAYEAKLTIIDTDGDEFSEIMPVEIDSAGVNAVISAKPIAGTVPLVVQFDGSGSSSDEGDIINYIWEFPDGVTVPYGAQISYEFPISGIYKVKLTILTDENTTATAEKLVSVRAQTLEVDFKPSAFEGEAPFTVTFDSSLSRGDIAEYRWEFGDGFIDRVAAPTHTYTIPGEYEVVLQVKDNNGIIDREIKTIRVK